MWTLNLVVSTAFTSLATAQLSGEFQETYCQAALTCNHHGLDPVCAQQFCQGDPSYGVPCWQLVGFGAQAQYCCTDSDDAQSCLIQNGIATPCQVCGDSSGGSDSSGSGIATSSGVAGGVFTSSAAAGGVFATSSGVPNGAPTNSVPAGPGSQSSSATPANPTQTGAASNLAALNALGVLGVVVGGMAVFA